MNLNVELFPFNVFPKDFTSSFSVDSAVIRPVAVGREAVGLRSLGFASCARDGAPGSKQSGWGMDPLAERELRESESKNSIYVYAHTYVYRSYTVNRNYIHSSYFFVTLYQFSDFFTPRSADLDFF